MRLVGLMALGSFLLHASLKKWKVRFGYAFCLYLAYALVGLTTVFFTEDRLGGVRQAGAIFGNVAFFFLMLNMARDWRMIKRTVMVWLVASALIGAYTAYEWHSGRSRVDESGVGIAEQRFSTVLQDVSEYESIDQVDREMGPTSSPAVYAINMILTIPFFFFLARTEADWRIRAVCMLGCLVCLYNVFLTNTRAAIVLAAVVMLVCFFRGMLVLSPGRLLAMVAVLGLLLTLAPGAIYRRVLDVNNYSYERSATLRVRLEYWSAALQLAEKHWLTGIGIGNQLAVPALAKIEGPDASTAHNEFLYTFVEVGAFGWLLFFGFIALLLRQAFQAASVFRRCREMQQQYWFLVACQTAMISVLLYAVQVDVFHFPLKGWWLVAGATCVTYGMAHREGYWPAAPGNEVPA